MSQYNLGGSAFYLASFSILLLPQVYLSIRYRTWGFLISMAVGLILELLAYISRILMHNAESQSRDHFILYLVSITIGPAFFSAGIYLCLARIINVYGQQFSPVKPRTYAVVFMIADFIALVLQSGGGAMAGSYDLETSNMGLKIVQAGLAVHLCGIAAFVALAGWFAWRAWKGRSFWDESFRELQTSRKFRGFLSGLAIATLCIFIRTCYRVAELSEGFDSKLWNDETAFMVLEGAMVLIACICITLYHPGMAFQGRWAEADFSLIAKNNTHSRKGSRGDDAETRRAVGHVPLDSM